MPVKQNTNSVLFLKRPLTARVLTPSGKGAVATIRISGDLQSIEEQARIKEVRFFEARNGKPLFQQRLQQIVYGSWGEEQLVICRVDEQTVEVHAHGGAAASARILDDLQGLGANIFPWDAPNDLCETDLAFWQLDYERQIAHAPTMKTVSWLMQQAENGPQFWKTSAEFLEQSSDHQAGGEFRDILASAECWSRFGKHLTVPYNVVMAGIPNAGKSSLLNRLLGFERAIISPIPGTTRDVVIQYSAFAGWPAQLKDTAGQREQAESLEASGIALARAAVASADLILLVVDAQLPPDPISLNIMADSPEAVLVLNKIDLGIHPDWQNHVDRENVQVSCKTSAGLPQLVELIGSRLVPEVPAESILFPVSELQRDLLKRIRQALQHEQLPADEFRK